MRKRPSDRMVQKEVYFKVTNCLGDVKYERYQVWGTHGANAHQLYLMQTEMQSYHGAVFLGKTPKCLPRVDLITRDEFYKNKFEQEAKNG